MFLKIIYFVLCSLMAIIDFASAGKNFSEEKWVLFGFRAYLAICWAVLAFINLMEA